MLSLADRWVISLAIGLATLSPLVKPVWMRVGDALQAQAQYSDTIATYKATRSAYCRGEPVDPWGNRWILGVDMAYSPGPNRIDEKRSGDDVDVSVEYRYPPAHFPVLYRWAPWWVLAVLSIGLANYLAARKVPAAKTPTGEFLRSGFLCSPVAATGLLLGALVSEATPAAKGQFPFWSNSPMALGTTLSSPLLLALVWIRVGVYRRATDARVLSLSSSAD